MFGKSILKNLGKDSFLKINSNFNITNSKSFMTKVKADKYTYKPGFSFMKRFFSTEDNHLLKLRNIGISAHIDSGKTTFTERVLFYTGRINKIHEVRGTDKVGAKMDSMELERERGITIQSAATFCNWKENYINIIDTPGHVDFTIEVERALRVLDGAVLLVCAASGVQPQTLTVNRQMNRYSVPKIVFINKCDRAGANPYQAVNQIRNRLNVNAALVQIPMGLENDFKGVIDVVTMKACSFEGSSGENVVEEEIPEKYLKEATETRKALIEAVAEFDPQIEEIYLTADDPTKEVKVEDLKRAIRKGCLERKFSPVFMGSAIKNKGIQKCLDGVIDYLPNPLEKVQKAFIHQVHPSTIQEGTSAAPPEEIELTNDLKKPFVGMAFKLQENKYGQLTFMRAYQGTLKRGDMINMVASRKKIKVSRIVKMHSDEMEEIHDVKCGEIFAIFGIDCHSGETFTADDRVLTLEKMHVPEVVMSLSIKPKRVDMIPKFLKAITRFQREDPTFRVQQNEETEEMIMSGMGELHLQVYAERIRREYEVDVDIGTPQVNYRESIAEEGEFNYLHKKQSGGAGQFARVVGKIEPLIDDFSKADDKSNVFVDKTGGKNIPHEYIPAIEKAFHEVCKKGPLTGSPVIGVKYTLEDGQTHVVDSSSLAFSIATKYSMTQAFEKANAVLLEPIMDVEASGPVEYQNGIMNTITKRKGNIYDMTNQNDTFVCHAEVSLNNMFGYATELRSITQGVGEFSMEYKFHLPVPPFELDDILEKKRREEESKKSDKKKGGGFAG